MQVTFFSKGSIAEIDFTIAWSSVYLKKKLSSVVDNNLSSFSVIAFTWPIQWNFITVVFLLTDLCDMKLHTCLGDIGENRPFRVTYNKIFTLSSSFVDITIHLSTFQQLLVCKMTILLYLFNRYWQTNVWDWLLLVYNCPLHHPVWAFMNFEPKFDVISTNFGSSLDVRRMSVWAYVCPVTQGRIYCREWSEGKVSK